MKAASLIFFSLIVSLTSDGCTIHGSGNITSETRSLNGFSGVELKNSADVYIEQGDREEVRVEAEDNLISHITTVIKNNALIIDEDKDLDAKGRITVFITVKNISMIELSGSGNIFTKNQLTAADMTIRLSGSGDIRSDLSVKTLKAAISGSGSLDVKGSAGKTDIRISGSGNINGSGFSTLISSVSITGSGTSTMDVRDELTVNITGSGNVYYVNEPGKINSKIIGSGEISKM